MVAASWREYGPVPLEASGAYVNQRLRFRHCYLRLMVPWWVARISIRDGEVVKIGDNGIRARLDTSTANTLDVPRFRALLWR